MSKETVLRTYRDTALPDAYRWQTSAFIRTQWSDVGGGEPQDPYPVELGPLHVVLARGELLLGYAGIITMTVRHGAQMWRVDGLGRVFTFPGARGSGHGRRLVDAATAAVRSGGADLGALLCEPGLRPFYARSGWITVEPGVDILSGPDEPPFQVPGPTVLLPVSTRARAAWATFEQDPLTVPYAW